MDVSQLINLAGWYQKHVPQVTGHFQQLIKVLDHNASQPQKQPVREPLENLLEALNELPVEELTNEEVSKLADLGVMQYLGPQGAEYVRQTVTQGEYDPATTASDIKSAHQTIAQKQQLLGNATKALTALDFQEHFETHVDGMPIVRVRFQDDASITDVHLLKKWSTDWYDIARGVAMCAGQSPNHVKVVGASNGSIILTLLGTAAVTRLLASIAKHVGSIVHEILQIAIIKEDLRHKRLLNETIESELTKRQKDLKEQGVDRTVGAVKEENADIVTGDGDADVALRKAVEKYLNFNNKGGDVDFLPPREVTDGHETETEGEDGVKSVSAEMRRLQDAIAEVRSQQAEIRLLSHKEVE